VTAFGAAKDLSIHRFRPARTLYRSRMKRYDMADAAPARTPRLRWLRSRALAAALSTLAVPFASATGAAPAQPASPAPAHFYGADLSQGGYGRSLHLPDMNGRMRSLQDFKGQVVVMFFGYTQCPDVCPTTLAELSAVKKALGPSGRRVQGLFVTVDPQRDTPELLKSYVTAFDPTDLALRGTPRQIRATADEFKVYYFKVPGKTPGSYAFSHSAGSLVIDTRGTLRLFEVYGQDTAAFASDIRALLAEAGD
jgi:protein SCO1/2